MKKIKSWWILVVLISGILLSACQNQESLDSEKDQEPQAMLENTEVTTKAEKTVEVEKTETEKIEETTTEETTTEETTTETTTIEANNEENIESQEITNTSETISEQDTSENGPIITEADIVNVNEVLLRDDQVIQESIIWASDHRFVIFTRLYESFDVEIPPNKVFIWQLGQYEQELIGIEGLVNELIVSPDEKYLFVSMGMNAFREAYVFEINSINLRQELGWITDSVLWSEDSRYLGYSEGRNLGGDLSNVSVDAMVYDTLNNLERVVVQGEISIEALFSGWDKNGYLAITKVETHQEEYYINFKELERGLTISAIDGAPSYSENILLNELIKDIDEIISIDYDYQVAFGDYETSVLSPLIVLIDENNNNRINKANTKVINAAYDELGVESLKEATSLEMSYDLYVVKNEYISVKWKSEYYIEETLIDTRFDSYTISVKDGYTPELFDLFTAEEHENVVADLISDHLKDREIELGNLFVVLDNTTRYYLVDDGIVFYYPTELNNVKGDLLEVKIAFEELEGVIDFENLPRF